MFHSGDQFYADQEMAVGGGFDVPAREVPMTDRSRRFPMTPALQSVSSRAPNLIDVGRPRGTFSQVPVTEEEEQKLPFSDEPPAGKHRIGAISPGGLLAQVDESRLGFGSTSVRRSSIIDFLRTEHHASANDPYSPDPVVKKRASVDVAAADDEVDKYSPPQVSSAHISMLTSDKLTMENIKGKYTTRLPIFKTAFRATQVLTLVTGERPRPKSIVRAAATGDIIDSPERWDIDCERAWCTLLAGIDESSFAAEIDSYTMNSDVCGLWSRLAELYQKVDAKSQLELYEKISSWNFLDPTLPYFNNIISPWLMLISLYGKIVSKAFPADAMWLLFQKLCCCNPNPHPAYQRFREEYPRHAERYWERKIMDTLGLIQVFIDFDSIRPPYIDRPLPAVMYSSTTVPQKATLARDGTCFDFARTGKCSRGNQCKYSHDIGTSMSQTQLTPQEATILDRRAAAGHTGGVSSRRRGPPHLIEAGTFVAKEHRDVLAAMNLRTDPAGKPGFWSHRQSAVLAALSTVAQSRTPSAVTPGATITSPASAYLIPQPTNHGNGAAADLNPWYAHLVNSSGPKANHVAMLNNESQRVPSCLEQMNCGR
jgi:hypothetical protein